MHTHTSSRLGFAALLLVIASSSGAGFAGAATVVPGPAPVEGTAAKVAIEDYHAQRRGWYVSTGLVGTAIDVDPGETEVTELRVEREGGGLELQVGYAFSETFALELRAVGAAHETERADVDAAFGQVQLDAVTHFNTSSRVQPYLAGGIGGAGFGVRGASIEDTTITGGQVDMGGGVEFLLNPRFSLALSYRYAVQHYEEKTVELDEGRSLVLSVDGEGRSHTWALQASFAF